MASADINKKAEGTGFGISRSIFFLFGSVEIKMDIFHQGRESSGPL